MAAAESLDFNLQDQFPRLYPFSSFSIDKTANIIPTFYKTEIREPIETDESLIKATYKHLDALLKNENFRDAVREGRVAFTFIKPGAGDRNQGNLSFYEISNILKQRAQERGLDLMFETEGQWQKKSLASFYSHIKTVSDGIEEKGGEGFWEKDFEDEYAKHPALFMLFYDEEGQAIEKLRGVEDENQQPGIIGPLWKTKPEVEGETPDIEKACMDKSIRQNCMSREEENYGFTLIHSSAKANTADGEPEELGELEKLRDMFGAICGSINPNREPKD